MSVFGILLNWFDVCLYLQNLYQIGPPHIFPPSPSRFHRKLSVRTIFCQLTGDCIPLSRISCTLSLLVSNIRDCLLTVAD